MKKLLIISYHALPLDVVASYRTKAYCDYLMENDIYPTLVTHRWEKDQSGGYINHKENDEVFYDVHSTHKLIRLPKPLEAVKSKSSLFTLNSWLHGNFDLHLLNSYNVFKTFLFSHLKINNYDAVLAIFSPHYHLKLAYEIQQKFGIPYILDFRDLWDNQIITKSYNPNFKRRIQNLIVRYYWGKWLKKSLFFTTTSEKWRSYLANISQKSGYKITNGHEVNNIPTSTKTEKFRIAYFGKLYPYQELNTMILGINRFLKEHPNIVDFELVLIGIKKTNDYDGVKIFRSEIDDKFFRNISYMSKEELIDFSLKNISLFILPNLHEDNGSFFVKLYDYISIGKPIILAPENNSENDKLIKHLNAGLVTSVPEDIASYLKARYMEFNENSKIVNPIKINEAMKLHRKHQVNKISKLISKEFLGIQKNDLD